jgi:hypothetical protein
MDYASGTVFALLTYEPDLLTTDVRRRPMEPWIESVYRQAKGAEVTRLYYLGRKRWMGVNTIVIELINCIRKKEQEIDAIKQNVGQRIPLPQRRLLKPVANTATRGSTLPHNRVKKNQTQDRDQSKQI